MALPEDGTRIPDFALKLATQDGVQDFTLAAALRQGPVVLAFFPLAFTGVCTRQMCDLRDDLARFEQAGATVYGFSTDSPFANVRFAKEQGLTHGILSDPNREVVEEIWDTQTVAGVHGVAKRGVLVLDTEGTVVWSWATDDPKQWIGTDEVRKALEPLVA